MCRMSFQIASLIRLCLELPTTAKDHAGCQCCKTSTMQTRQLVEWEKQLRRLTQARYAKMALNYL